MKRVIIAVLFLFVTARLDAASINDKVDSLDKKLSQIEKTYFNNNVQIASGLSKVDTFEGSINEVKGELQVNRHIIDKTKDDLFQRISEIEHRISTIEERFSIFSQQLTSALKKVDPTVADEGAIYQVGLDQMNKADYLGAVATFQKLIKKYPKSNFIPHATYSIADSYYSMHDWKTAIKKFQSFASAYPKSDKVPGAVLKQGLSFQKLKMHEEAKLFLDDVIKKYPSSLESNQARQKLNEIKNEQQVLSDKSKVGGVQSSYPETTLQDKIRKGGDAHKPTSSTSEDSEGDKSATTGNN